MTLRPVPDEGVLGMADAFREAARALNVFPESRMSVPTVVNAAFALELYLKSMNVEWQLADPNERAKAGGKSWLKSRKAIQTGHDPSKLFAALVQFNREYLEQRFQTLCIGTGPQSLAENLAQYDGIFQDWRYAFEGRTRSFDIGRILALLAFFSDAIHAMPQTWA
jgi:hypothetical protein